MIEPEKLVDYLLNTDHPDGWSKAQLLASMGYSRDRWQQLDFDLRIAHLGEDIIATKTTPWGDRYEIVGPLTGPNGDTIMFRSVWQIDLGSDAPRLITMFPE